MRYRPGYGRSPTEPESAHHLASQRQSDPGIEDDFGAEIPIKAAELDVLETYLSHLLDRLFTRTAEQSSPDKGEISC
jgi:hypothetical protein